MAKNNSTGATRTTLFTFVVLLVGVFLLNIPTASAATFDNVKDIKTISIGESFSIGEYILNYNPIWETYKPIEIKNLFGLGKTLFQGAITQHDKFCGLNCSSTIQVYLNEESILINDIDFYTIQSNDVKIKEDIIRYKLYANNNLYELGTVMPEGNYEIRLEGQKDPLKSVDWQITVNGKILSEWAVWDSLIYDNIDDSSIDTDLWTNSSSGSGTYKYYATVNENNDYLQIWHWIQDAAGSGEIVSTNLTIGDAGYFENLTVRAYIGLDTHSSAYDHDATIKFNVFGNVIKNFSVHDTGNVDVSDTSTWTFEKSGSQYKVYDDGAYLKTINKLNNEVGITTWGDENRNYPIHLDGRIYYVYYTLPIAPEIDISYPAATTYAHVVNNFTWTLSNSTYMDTCQYSLNGAANESINCATLPHLESITSVEGSNTIILSVEDNNELVHSDSVTFTQNIPYPSATITYPVNGTTYDVAVSNFTWSITNYTTLDDCFYSINGTTNVSVTCTDLIESISVDDGIYNILFTLNDTQGQMNWTQNYFTQDTTAPVINVTYPYETITNETISHTLYFNWTATDATNETTACWFNYNNTNTTVTCGDQNTTFVTNIAGQRNITFYSNDSFNNVANFTRYWDYKMLERTRTFNYTTYETTTDSFILNISSDGLQTVSAKLWYNNTEYAATKVGSNTEMTFNSTVSHPWGESGNRTFYWTVDHGGTLINTTSDGQYINPIMMGYCNATLTQPFINFTFKNEETDLFINSTFEVYDWFYYTGDGSQNKTFDYVNLTEQESYSFCATPNLTFHNNASIKYKSLTYPERTYTQSVDLTNTTTYTTLYLLGTDYGQYVSFQVQDTNGLRLNGVTITVEKSSSGVWTTVGTDLTDSSGLATFFLNYNDDHRITAEKTDYTTYISTIRPTNSIYTIVLEGGTTYETYYTFEGIKYNTYPKTGTILAPNTTYTFGFNVTSSVGNISACKMIITNSSFSEIGSSTGCGAYGGNITLALGTGDATKYFGNYYVNLGSGYELISSNNVWMIENINISSDGAYGFELMTKFGNYSGFGEGNKASYNSITFFFILLIIALGLFTKFTGLEFISPGYTLVILTGIIIMFSITGLFEFDGAVRNTWLNKYSIAIMTTMLTSGYLINYWRRNTT